MYRARHDRFVPLRKDAGRRSRGLRAQPAAGHGPWCGLDYDFVCPSTGTYPLQWLWDSCFHAVVLSRFDRVRARSEIRSLLANAQPDGFIAHVTFWQREDYEAMLATYSIAYRTLSPIACSPRSSRRQCTRPPVAKAGAPSSTRCCPRRAASSTGWTACETPTGTGSSPPSSPTSPVSITPRSTTPTSHLEDRSAALVERVGFREYYDPHTGEGFGAEGFSWTALVLDMLATLEGRPHQ